MLQKVEIRNLSLEPFVDLCPVGDFDEVGARVHHHNKVIGLKTSALDTPQPDDIGCQRINHLPCAKLGRRVFRQVHILRVFQKSFDRLMVRGNYKTMLSPGYYIIQRDTILTLGSRRIRLRKHDWLVTDGQYLGVFDKELAMDWVPVEGASGQPLVLTDEIGAQVDSIAAPVAIGQLERRLKLLLDTGDGAPIPDMPRAPLNALGSYLRAHRTLLAYTYEH